MIDWLLSFFKSEDDTEWTYTEAKVPLQNSGGCCGVDEKVWYKVPVRKSEDKVQILAGRPKFRSWKTVESEDIKHTIQKQL